MAGNRPVQPRRNCNTVHAGHVFCPLTLDYCGVIGVSYPRGWSPVELVESGEPIMQHTQDLLGLGSLGGGGASCEPLKGIKALMAAVLENGISCYLSSTPRLRAEAEYWIGTRADRSPFSFAVVCETLAFEPDAVRAALRRLRNAEAPVKPAFGRRRAGARRAGRLVARVASQLGSQSV
jgi:hypothetical protein